MRISLLVATVSFAFCGVAHAAGSFTLLQTVGVQINKVSGNGSYVVGIVNQSGALRFKTADASEEVIDGMDYANGINNLGTVSGATPLDGGINDGGTDLAAYSAVGASPANLNGQLSDNAQGWDIADNGTVVGASFDSNYVSFNAFVWTAAGGMTLLPVNRPENASRADSVSADGSVISGYNDGDGRNAVIWKNGVLTELADPSGNPLDGTGTMVSSNGKFVIGSYYTDAHGVSGAWRYNVTTGAVDVIAGLPNGFGISNDGRTAVGSSGFFDTPQRAAYIWHEDVGTEALPSYLAAHGVTIPEELDPNLPGGFSGISGDGTTVAGWTFGQGGDVSYVIHIVPTATPSVPVPADAAWALVLLGMLAASAAGVKFRKHAI